MTKDWQEVHLADVADVTVGYVGPMAAEYVPAGVPFLRSLNVRAHAIDLTGVKFVSREFHESIRKSALKPDDVVTVRTGKPGATAVVPESLPEANCSDMLITRCGPDVDPHWLSYYINGVAQGFVSSRLVGAVQQHFNVGAAKELVLRMPSIDQQRAIAAALRALDEKIAVESSIADLVPRILRLRVETALTEVHESIPVSSLARFINGGAYTKGASGTGRMVIRIAELNGEPGNSTVYNDIDVPDNRVARAGDILMSWSGSLGVYRWSRDEAIVNQHIFKVEPLSYPSWLVFDRLDLAMSDFRQIARDKATTMGHIQRGHLDSTEIPIPTDGAMDHLNGPMDQLWERLLLADRQIHTLGRLRDALLPELLSGRLQVSKAATVS